MRKMSEDTKKAITDYIMKNPDEVKKSRVEFLKAKKRKIKDQLIDWILKMPDNLLEYLDINEELNSISRIDHEINRYNNPKITEGITDEMIETAREYPIERLIKVNDRGFAVCPFHNDKNPSAYCKKNYLYCFSCNTQADTIKLYMHLNDCDFKTAVNNLQ